MGVCADTDEVVADSSHYLFTLEVKNLTWGPRSCRTGVSETWDERVWNQPTALPDDQALGGVPVLVSQLALAPTGSRRSGDGWVQ